MNKNFVFNYPLIEFLCQKMKELLNFQVIDCSAFGSHRFILSLQKERHRKFLLFCFTPPFVRFHLVNPSSMSEMKMTPSPLAPFLKKSILTNIETLQKDRIIQLTFQTSKGVRYLVAEFFSKHPNYYFLSFDRTILFALHPCSRTHYSLPPKHTLKEDELLHFSSHEDVERAYQQFEQDSTFQSEKNSVLNGLMNQVKKLEKKKQALVQRILECTEWEKVQHEGELIKFHFSAIKKGMSLFTVQDWTTDEPYELKLDPKKSLQEEMAKRFNYAKKLQRGIYPLQIQLELTQKHIERTSFLWEKFNLLSTVAELEKFKLSNPSFVQTKNPSISRIATSPIYREYRSTTGIQIWVGKNARANDRLTFQLANGRDWWLHCQAFSGSHVIIRLSKDQEPDSETLKDAFQLALYHSKVREQKEGEVCYTQRKYVSKLNQKKAGLVQISRHKTAWIRLEEDRLQRLKNTTILSQE